MELQLWPAVVTYCLFKNNLQPTLCLHYLVSHLVMLNYYLASELPENFPES